MYFSFVMLLFIKVAEQERVMTLDPKSGERALVIKNTYGDWGILVGRWDGYKVGVPAKRGINITGINSHEKGKVHQ